MKHPRADRRRLVDAYLARRALDYLVGFTLSPVLWRKLPGARSAGRVQSVALRLVCDRELEIERFVPREYWSLVAHLADRRTARRSTPGSSAPTASGSTASTSARATEAAAFKAALRSGHLLGRSSRGEARQAAPVRRPSPPRRCSRRPRASSALRPARTMQIAQRLYEGVDIGGETVGLITYMRTDGVDMAPEAIAGARKCHRQGIRRALSAGRAAQIHRQGQERPGSARGDPPDRHQPPAEACRAAASSPSRRGSTN